jgi:hypothetical protein
MLKTTLETLEKWFETIDFKPGSKVCFLIFECVHFWVGVTAPKCIYACAGMFLFPHFSFILNRLFGTQFLSSCFFFFVFFFLSLQPSDGQLTFHLPLHRYLAAFLMLGVQSHGYTLASLLPSHDMLTEIMMHPLQIQVNNRG